MALTVLLDFAKWTKHSSGMGLKLLQKMGWKPGQGLGVSEHGIARPIDVR
jgi:tuftelin-interacting protein 11